MVSVVLVGVSMCTTIFFLIIRRPPRSTRTDTLFPYTTLFRSLEVGVVGDKVAGRRQPLGKRPLPPGDDARQRAHHLVGDLVLHVEHIRQLAVVAVRPQDVPGLRVGQARADAHARALATDAGVEHGRHPEFPAQRPDRSEEPTSELQSLMRISY